MVPADPVPDISLVVVRPADDVAGDRVPMHHGLRHDGLVHQDLRPVGHECIAIPRVEVRHPVRLLIHLVLEQRWEIVAPDIAQVHPQ